MQILSTEIGMAVTLVREVDGVAKEYRVGYEAVGDVKAFFSNHKRTFRNI